MKNFNKKSLQITVILFVIIAFFTTINAQAQTIGASISIGKDSQVKYWDGSAWIVVNPGLPGQDLQFTNGIPLWVNNLEGIVTTTATSITGNTAISGGIVKSNGGAPIIARGVCWNTTQNPTLINFHTSDSMGMGSFNSTINGLLANTTYYVRAYATNSAGTAYGTEISFTTDTIAGLSIGQSYEGGIIVYLLQPGDTGYSANIQKGLIVSPTDLGVAEWGYYGIPVTNAYGTAIGTGKQNTIAIVNSGKQQNIAAKLCFDYVSGGYSDWYLPSIEELNKIYINRALIGGFSQYAYWSSSENYFVTAMIQYFYDVYGDQTGIYYNDYKTHPYTVRAIRSFPNNSVLPTVTTASINTITDYTAVSGGNITSDGGAPITASGLCWSTSPNPTINDSLLYTTTTLGSFVYTLSVLIPGTTYYVRAYATNNEGTAYGNQESFITTGIRPIAIGDSILGGIVAYLLQPGDAGYDANIQHGLIAAPFDQSTSAQWYNGVNTTTGASGYLIGSGAANTDSIVLSQGAGTYAAKICSDLVLNGYSDWYLASMYELNQLFINRVAIGGFDYSGYYWSSTENSDNTYAYVQWFYNGYQVIDVKTSAYPIRAVRSF